VGGVGAAGGGWCRRPARSAGSGHSAPRRSQHNEIDRHAEGVFEMFSLLEPVAVVHKTRSSRSSRASEISSPFSPLTTWAYTLATCSVAAGSHPSAAASWVRIVCTKTRMRPAWSASIRSPSASPTLANDAGTISSPPARMASARLSLGLRSRSARRARSGIRRSNSSSKSISGIRQSASGWVVAYEVHVTRLACA